MAGSQVRSASASAREADSPDSAKSPAPREVPLQVLHNRSEPLSLSHQILVQGLDSARRLDALEWLVQAFDALSLSDTQLFAAFGLLDRFAAASSAPISAGPGAFALVLAAMLVALKVAGTQKDLEKAKKLVVEVSGSQKPWAAVRKAEINILRRLGFKACTPTSRDLLDRLLGKTLPEGAVGYDEQSLERCRDLARFLLELGLVHEPEAIYGGGRPPLAAAVSAALVAVIAFGGPHSARAIDVLKDEPLGLLDADNAVPQMAEAMRQRWATEERRLVEGNGSVVLDKWLRRVGSFGTCPPAVADLQRLSMESVAPPALVASSARMNSPVRPPTVRQQSAAVLAPAVLPTDSAAMEEAPQRASVDPAPPQLISLPTALPRPTGVVPSARKQGTALSSRVIATENHSSWAKLPSPQHHPRAGLAARAVAPAPRGGGATSRSPERASELLVDLTHVLNMAAPRPAQGLGGHGGGPNIGESKPKALGVAAELLVSSALRMQWPADKRKVDPSDAAATCREAAAVLQEAALHLANTAASLDGGGGPAAPIKSLVAVVSSETKRRRTVGGPPPVALHSHASSPHGPTARGSPPVRFAGLRV